MIPVRRDIHFNLPADRALDWHGGGRYISHFLNTLSVFFPVGERFFISSVRHYRDQVTDPNLQRAVTAFIGQEAMHGREHEDYNKLLAAAGLPIEKQEDRVRKVLAKAQKLVPPIDHLAATIALEHFTAILADRVLGDAKTLAGSHPAYAQLWRWHALEETEHKSVAFDVWKTVQKPGLRSYLKRSRALLIATAIFGYHITRHYKENIDADPKADNHFRGLMQLARFLLVSPGTVRKSIGPWFAYFRPSFHPWDHDNSAYIQQLENFQPQ